MCRRHSTYASSCSLFIPTAWLRVERLLDAVTGAVLLPSKNLGVYLVLRGNRVPCPFPHRVAPQPCRHADMPNGYGRISLHYQHDSVLLHEYAQLVIGNDGSGDSLGEGGGVTAV
ncbi:hypothetical protein EV191_11118 [Tamaricihabitans halophyticus]|uniref:Uncharacterized protein n=1 Tax=Tamaricihabitans halophyticus TaxID=1262583 RepID=A0A4R2QFA8_9PSEU|nr:hypothetical protein EV191_11118 [Tamaricihabitans halophyticus]